MSRLLDRSRVVMRDRSTDEWSMDTMRPVGRGQRKNKKTYEEVYECYETRRYYFSLSTLVFLPFILQVSWMGVGYERMAGGSV